MDWSSLLLLMELSLIDFVDFYTLFFFFFGCNYLIDFCLFAARYSGFYLISLILLDCWTYFSILYCTCWRVCYIFYNLDIILWKFSSSLYWLVFMLRYLWAWICIFFVLSALLLFKVFIWIWFYILLNLGFATSGRDNLILVYAFFLSRESNHIIGFLSCLSKEYALGLNK
jgi:hypothetical protein